MVDLSEKKLARLRKAMTFSSKKLQPFRRARFDAYKQFVGANYSDDGASQKMPVNMLELATSIYLRQLASANPRVNLTTRDKSLRPTAMKLEAALNHLIEEVNLGDSLQRVVQDALFSVGIMKVGLEVRDVEGELGITHDAGQPFADPVSLDDWVHDMTATTWNHVTFCGNRYRVPTDWLREQQDLGVSPDKIKPTDKTSAAADGGSDSKGIDSISLGSNASVEEFEEHTDLWDIWLPRDNVIVTLLKDSEGPPVFVKEWNGPERGPFHLFGFTDVPGNTMPLSPVSAWVDLNDLANRLWRKLGRQSERQKTVLGVQGHAQADGQRIIEASDGEAISTENPDGVREYRFGGPDNNVHGFSLNVLDRLGYHMGGLDVLGGLAPASGTVGQDKMLKESSSTRMQSMQEQVTRFAEKVVQDIALYLYEDPLIELPLSKYIPEADFTYDFTWTPEQREGDFLNYNIKIDPFSMKAQSPSEKLSQLTDLLMNIVLPGQQMFVEQGGRIDLQEYIKMVAKYSNLPEIESIVVFDDEPIERGGGPPASDPNGGTYEHVSTGSSQTPGSQRAATSQDLMSNTQPPSQPNTQQQ
jgi:hypothetical protein